MKNAILAILGCFVLSSAFACSSAPPPSVQKEFVVKAYDLAVPYDVVIDLDQKVFAVPAVNQKLIFNANVVFPDFRPGFVYRNVDYERLNHFYNRQTSLLINTYWTDTSSYTKEAEPLPLPNYRFSYSLRKSSRDNSVPDKSKDSDIVHRC